MDREERMDREMRLARWNQMDFNASSLKFTTRPNTNMLVHQAQVHQAQLMKADMIWSYF